MVQLISMIHWTCIQNFSIIVNFHDLNLCQTIFKMLIGNFKDHISWFYTLKTAKLILVFWLAPEIFGHWSCVCMQLLCPSKLVHLKFIIHWSMLSNRSTSLMQLILQKWLHQQVQQEGDWWDKTPSPRRAQHLWSDLPPLRRVQPDWSHLPPVERQWPSLPSTRRGSVLLEEEL